MSPDIIFTPSDFVAVFNQTLEVAYANVVIEGELANFKVSKNRWLYFDVKDEAASVSFFGSVYQLPGPLQDGLMIRVVGVPKLHPRFGFKINLLSITPTGEGSLKKAADLLMAKLAAEGLFELTRKRPLPALPARIGLITAADSAAAADFIKIVSERFGGSEIILADSLVQGERAPLQLVSAIDQLNRLSALPDVIVVTRGGGSADDLAAFNDERVVRAVAASRVPTLVAIGHEVDLSLAELAADVRASTPTNAAQLVVPDRAQLLTSLSQTQKNLAQQLEQLLKNQQDYLADAKLNFRKLIESVLISEKQKLSSAKRLTQLFDPRSALKRGYSLVTRSGQLIGRVAQLKSGDKIKLQFYDGAASALVQRKK